MQVPLWLFVSSLLLALSWLDLRGAMFALRQVSTQRGSGWRGIKSAVPLLFREPASFSQRTSHSAPPTHITATPNKHHSTSTQNKMSSPSTAFLDALKARRSIYPLKKESTIPDSKVQEIIESAVLHVPSSFNSQSTRVVLLVKEEHDTLWQIAKDVLKAMVSEEQWKSTEQRLNGFKAAYGTVLFFESREAVQKMQDKYVAYAERFPSW